MNSISSSPPDCSELACIDGRYYFKKTALHGKKPLYAEEKPNVEEPEPKIVRTYDEVYLFYLFCSVNGRMPELLALVESLPKQVQERIPKQATLYKIAKDNAWRERFEEIRKKVREDLESRNGLPFTKIDQLASYFLQGTLMRAVSALREENFKDFGIKDLKDLWMMQRTERGLAATVPYRDQNQETYNEQIKSLHAQEKYKDSTAGPEFYDRLAELSPEEMKIVSFLFTGKNQNSSSDDDIPGIIRKR